MRTLKLLFVAVTALASTGVMAKDTSNVMHYGIGVLPCSQIWKNYAGKDLGKIYRWISRQHRSGDRRDRRATPSSLGKCFPLLTRRSMGKLINQQHRISVSRCRPLGKGKLIFTDPC